MTNRAKSLVKETSTTTGTGNYTLAGAATGFRRFQDAYTSGTTTFMPYIARMGADFEIGIGKLSANTTLERFHVVESSNANAAVSWGAGTKDIYCSTGGNWGPQGRHNFDGAAVPIYSDNYEAGYGSGSLWVDRTNERYYLCVHDGSHVASGGNAVWIPLQPGIGPLWRYDGSIAAVYSNDFSRVGNNVAKNGLTPTGANVFGTGAQVEGNWSRVVGFGFSASSDFGAHQLIECGYCLETTDATPTNAKLFGFNSILQMPPDSAFLLRVSAVARDSANDELKAWTLDFLVDRSGSGDPSIIGSPAAAVVAASAAAAAWDLSVDVDTGDDGPVLVATGAAAKTIRWTLDVRVVQVANY